MSGFGRISTSEVHVRLGIPSQEECHFVLPMPCSRGVQRLHEAQAVACRGSPRTKGVRKRGGLGLKKTLELDILQNFITCAKEINCFRILFAC